MKTRILTIMALSALVFSSCTKENFVEKTEAPISIETSFGGSLDEIGSKLTLDGLHCAFNDGDQILVQQYRTNSEISVETEDIKNIFTYSGSEGKFKGTLKYPYVSSRWYVYSLPQYVTYVSFGGSYCTTWVNPVQTGKAEDFGDYLLYFTLLSKSSYKAVGQTEYNISASATDLAEEINFKDTTFTIASTVIKMNVPAELGVKKITLTAVDTLSNTVNLSGTCTMKGSSRYLSEAPNTSYITIDRGEEGISGDVYFCIAPSKANSTRMISDADSLTFAFLKEDGSYATYSGKIDSRNNPLKAGTLYNFGTVPTTLAFGSSSEISLDKPSQIKYLNPNADKKTFTAKVEGAIPFPAGCDSTEYAKKYFYGAEISSDNGLTWTKVEGENLSSDTKYSVSFEGCLFESNYVFRLFAGLKELAAAKESYGPQESLAAMAGSYMIPVSLTDFTEDVAASATKYDAKAFYLNGSGYRMVANGTFNSYVYNKVKSIKFQKGNTFSLPVPTGMKLTDALVFINSSQKNVTIYKSDGTTAVASQTSKSTTATSAVYDSDAIRFYRMTPTETTENETYLLSTTASGSYSVYIPEIYLFYTPVGTQTTVDKIGTVDFDGSITSSSIVVTGGAVSDYAYGFEKKEAGSWTLIPSTDGTLNEGVLSFSTTTVFEENDTLRVYAYPQAAQGSYEEKVQYGATIVKPGMSITIDFTAGCPFEKFGEEKNDGNYSTSLTKSDTYSIYLNPRSGYDFPTSKQSVSSPKNSQTTIPTVSNGGGCFWGSYTSSGKTTTQWWSCYPLTTFKIKGTDYTVGVGSNIEARDGYVYYSSTDNTLRSNKLRIAFPNISGYKASKITIEYTVSTTAAIHVSRYYKASDDATVATYSRLLTASGMTTSDSPVIFDVDQTKISETDWVVLGSDNLPIISKITVGYKAVETKASTKLSNEGLGENVSYNY